jgi:hypothetical protein
MLGAHADMVVPDAVAPALGWRSWNTRVSFDRQVLVSPTQSTVWPHRPGTFLQAVCEHTKEERLEGCHCGVNAWATEEQLSQDKTYASCLVWGQVKLWGEVHTFETGLRGECAAPARLFVSPRCENAQGIAQALAETYGVSVEIAEHPAWTPTQDEAPPAQEPFKLRRALLLALGFAVATVASNWLSQWQLNRAYDAIDYSVHTVHLPELWQTLAVSVMIFGLVASIVTAVGIAIFWTGESMWSAVLGWGLVIMAVLAPLYIHTNVYDTSMGTSPITQKRLAAKTVRTGQPVIAHAADIDRGAWISEYGSIHNGSCRQVHASGHTVKVCRQDDTVALSLASGDKQCHSVEALAGVRVCEGPGGKLEIDQAKQSGADHSLRGAAYARARAGHSG